MTVFLLKLFDISASACFLICAVLILRLIFKKAPLYIRCLMWALVGLRLIMPFSIESDLSLVPSSSPVSSYVEQNLADAVTPPTTEGIPHSSTDNEALSPSVPTSPSLTNDSKAFQSIILEEHLFWAWAFGAAAMLLYVAISYFRLKRKVKNAVVYDEDVRIYNGKGAPFLLGVIKPKTYVPLGFQKEQLDCIVAHEKAHVKGLDHVFKPIAFVILSLHWFNPLAWVAYVLYCKDTELACDERAVRKMDMTRRKQYSLALLSYSGGRLKIASPLAFGEGEIKERVKRVINYKRPSLGIVLAAIVALTITAVLFVTSPVTHFEDLQNDSIGKGESIMFCFENAEEFTEWVKGGSDKNIAIDDNGKKLCSIYEHPLIEGNRSLFAGEAASSLVSVGGGLKGSKVFCYIKPDSDNAPYATVRFNYYNGLGEMISLTVKQYKTPINDTTYDYWTKEAGELVKDLNFVTRNVHTINSIETGTDKHTENVMMAEPAEYRNYVNFIYKGADVVITNHHGDFTDDELDNILFS